VSSKWFTIFNSEAGQKTPSRLLLLAVAANLRVAFLVPLLQG
jgi:hypothetical protein